MTLEQGAATRGEPLDDARRLRLGDYLLSHPDVHPAVERWGGRTFILTEDEKLLGRHLAGRARDGQGELSAADAAAALGCSTPVIERGLGALRRVGLLEWHSEKG